MNFNKKHKERNNDKGIALMTTLFISILIFLLAGGLLLYTRREYQIGGGQLTSMQAQYAADAGIQYAIASMQKVMADNSDFQDIKIKSYYWPLSNTSLYDPNNLEASSTVAVPPYNQPYWWPHTHTALPGDQSYIWKCKNLYKLANDPEWRWVLRYSGALPSSYNLNVPLKGIGAASASFLTEWSLDNTISSFNIDDASVYLWWYDQLVTIKSTGEVGYGSNVAGKRSYEAELKIFAKRKPTRWYYGSKGY
ncbi:MAG: hypothetical protein ABIH00_04315 [Armatimonadota bacterium]